MIQKGTASFYYLYNVKNKLANFEYFFRHILSYLKEEYGPDHLRVAKALNNLAVLYCLEVCFVDKCTAFSLFDALTPCFM